MSEAKATTAARPSSPNGHRPQALPVLAENVPAVIKDLTAWVVWKYVPEVDPETGETDWDKPPFSASGGKPASSTNPKTWASFRNAYDRYRKGGWDGVGLVLDRQKGREGPGLVGVDLDKCRDPVTGAVEPWALQIVRELDTYTEVSPSGRGLRLFLLGRLPPHGRKKGLVEMYEWARYVTVTGQHVEGTPSSVEGRGEQLLAVHRRVFGERAEKGETDAGLQPVDLSDMELVEKARRAKNNGARFAALFDRGDTSGYASKSEADAALANYLAYWTAGDRGRIDTLFRASRLFRGKWNRDDYRDRTIDLAMNGRTDFYRPQEVAERPVVQQGLEEHKAVAEAVKALAGGDPGLYQRGGQLVRVMRPSRPPQGLRLRPSGSPRPEPVPPADLRGRLTKVARFVIPVKGQKTKAARPARWLVDGVAALGQWEGIRHLEAVVESPVLRPDGSVLDRPGYDPETGLLYEPSTTYPPCPARPTRDDAVRACEQLLEVVCDFPFEHPYHRSAWLAALLTPPARFAFEGPSPFNLADANIRGAGKGLLWDTVACIDAGRELARVPYTRDDDEMRKTITALALGGERLVLLDNLSGLVGGPSLDAALTSSEWQGRILGRSSQPRLPLLATWFGTGNNVQLGADMARRTCHVRLLSHVEKPEDRDDFRHPDLLGWCRKERPRLLTAGLTVLSAYCRAGRPSQDLPPWGSFGGWSGLVRSAVAWAGVGDAGQARITLAGGTDREAAALHGLLACWRELDPEGKGLSISQALDKLKNCSTEYLPTTRQVFAEVFNLKPGELPSAGQLGVKLRGFKERVCGGFVFEGETTREGVNRWRVKDTISPSCAGDAGDAGGVQADLSAQRVVPGVTTNVGGRGNMPSMPCIPSIDEDAQADIADQLFAPDGHGDQWEGAC